MPDKLSPDRIETVEIQGTTAGDMKGWSLDTAEYNISPSAIPSPIFGFRVARCGLSVPITRCAIWVTSYQPVLVPGEPATGPLGPGLEWSIRSNDDGDGNASKVIGGESGEPSVPWGTTGCLGLATSQPCDRYEFWARVPIGGGITCRLQFRCFMDLAPTLKRSLTLIGLV